MRNKISLSVSLFLFLITIKLFSFSWPVSLTTTPFESAYGSRDRSSTSYVYDFHNGMDVEASLGTPLYAAHSGEVLFVDNNDNQPSGRYVSLINTTNPNNYDYKTVYMHLNTITVSNGQQVTEGVTQIGTTGNSSSYQIGAHLHYEYRLYPGVMNIDDRHPMEVMPDAYTGPGSGITVLNIGYTANNAYLELSIEEKNLDLNKVVFICYYLTFPTSN